MFATVRSLLRPDLAPRRRRRRPQAACPVAVDTLEARVLPAGNVTVTTDSSSGGTDLIITGDGLANKIEIYQTSLDNYVVVGKSLGGTTKINGVAGRVFRFTLDSITDDVIINMGGGGDSVYIRGTNSDLLDLDVQGDLQIDMGSGNDALTLKYVDVWNDLRIDLGTGLDKLTASYINVEDDAYLTSSNTSRSLVKQTVNLTSATFGDVLDIDLNFSLAVVNLVSTRSAALNVELGSGNDKLNVKYSRATTFDLDGGDGTDALNFYRNTTAFSGQDFLSPTFRNVIYT